MGTKDGTFIVQYSSSDDLISDIEVDLICKEGDESKLEIVNDENFFLVSITLQKGLSFFP